MHRRVLKSWAFAIATLAMTVSFLAQITPLWATQPSGTSITICSTLGSRTITIDENGDEIPSSPTQEKQTKEHCTLCLISTADTAPSPYQAYTTLRIKTQKTTWHIKNILPKQNNKKTPHSPRAPPHYS